MIETDCCGDDIPSVFYLTCEKTTPENGAWLVVCKGFTKNGLLTVEDLSAWMTLESAKYQAESRVGFVDVEWHMVDGTESNPKTFTAKVEFNVG